MQFKHVLGPESLKTSKVGGPEPSSPYGIAGDPTGPGSQNFFVAPGHEHTRQCSGRTAHLSIPPTLLWARLVAPLSAPASCGCFPLSCTGRSVTSPRPFTCVPGRAVAPLRCTHRRKLVLSPKRTLPEEGHTVFLSSLCSLPFYFCIQRSCGFSGGMRRRQPWTPWPSTSRAPLSGGCLHHTDPLVVFTRCVFVGDFGGPLLPAGERALSF